MVTEAKKEPAKEVPSARRLGLSAQRLTSTDSSRAALTKQRDARLAYIEEIEGNLDYALEGYRQRAYIQLPYISAEQMAGNIQALPVGPPDVIVLRAKDKPDIVFPVMDNLIELSNTVFACLVAQLAPIWERTSELPGQSNANLLRILQEAAASLSTGSFDAPLATVLVSCLPLEFQHQILLGLIAYLSSESYVDLDAEETHIPFDSVSPVSLVD